MDIEATGQQDVYLQRSRISGTGVFAARRFRAGEWILSFTTGARPRAVTYAETTRVPRLEGNYVQVGPDRYILPVPPSLYLNHSCDPNTGVSRATEIISLTDIEAGAELTFDYSTTMAEDGWEINCACRSGVCRGRIRDFRHLPPARQLYYLERGVVGDFCVANVISL